MTSTLYQDAVNLTNQLFVELEKNLKVISVVEIDKENEHYKALLALGASIDPPVNITKECTPEYLKKSEELERIRLELFNFIKDLDN